MNADNRVHRPLCRENGAGGRPTGESRGFDGIGRTGKGLRGRREFRKSGWEDRNRKRRLNDRQVRD